MSNSKREVSERRWIFWDREDTATGASEETWFVDINGKSAEQTNLSTPGQFPVSNKLILDVIRLMIHPFLSGGTFALSRDMWEIMRGRYRLIFDNDHVAWEGHGYDLPAAAGLHASLDGAAAASVIANNGFPSFGNRRVQNPSIDIEGGEHFKLVASWLQATTTVSAGSVRSDAILEGYYNRPTKG